MASQYSPIRRLQKITECLSSTPADRMPSVASHLSKELLNCKSILTQGSEDSNKGSESARSLHQFKTQISTILQSKSVGSRWCAVVLVKTAIEVGGLEPFHDIVNSWIRNLLGILGRPDPASVKKTVIITLTRMFLLSHSDPKLVREITTPALPTFISNSLNCISIGPQNSRTVKISSSLLQPVLQAFSKLLPIHPNTFRPYLGQLRAIIAPLIAPTPSDKPDAEPVDDICLSQHTRGLAHRFHALLPSCAPKGDGSRNNGIKTDASKKSPSIQWLESLNVVLNHAHVTADHVFRSLKEENVENGPSHRKSNIRPLKEIVGNQIEDELGLRAWSGVLAGTERLIGVLQLLQAYIATSSKSAVSLPVSAIWSLVERLLSLFGPSMEGKESSSHTRHNPESDRGEREDLWSVLPGIHEAAVEVVLILLGRLETTSMGFAQTVLERMAWAFERDLEYDRVRSRIYEAAATLLAVVGPSLTKSDIVSLKLMISKACSDGLSVSEQYLGFEVMESAAIFMEALMTRTLSRNWPTSLRASIDRNAILQQNMRIMTASVLNPPRSNSNNTTSIIPFLARAYPDTSEVEATLRPRLPIIKTGIDRDLADEDSEEESEDYDAHRLPEAMETDHPISTTSSSPITSDQKSSLQNVIVEAAPAPVHENQSPKRLRDAGSPRFESRDLYEATEPGTKRPRTAGDVAGPVSAFHQASEQLGTDDQKIVSSTPSFFPQTSTTATAVVGSQIDNKEDDDSDSSGSEIPPINIDLDLSDESDDDVDGGET